MTALSQEQQLTLMMTPEGLALFWGSFTLHMILVTEGSSVGCGCPAATILIKFPSNIPNDTCCLNFSGSTFNQVHWAAFLSHTHLQVLDLTNCNISHIDHSEVRETSLTSLRELYLSQNRLSSLPADFLSKAYSLEMLDLGMNNLTYLPKRFLQNSENLQVLILGWNKLSSLPGSVFKPSLQHLELFENPWACTCTLWEGLQGGRHDNSSGFQGLVGNLTCASPQTLAGRMVWSLQNRDVCHLANLTALFILLPLLLLLSLVLCWCCGRKKKRKETSSFSPAHKRPSNSQCNGRWPHDKLPTGQSPASVDNGKEVILRNQLMLQPSSTLLDSTRDIYEEVEIKLGSVESLANPSSTCSTEGTAVKQDLDAVSVSEVMKDSADREKAYLTQSTEYYSLVPGIEMDDSDHGEYESVDLS
ncbi:leucine-rich repeat, immunoglobulin-like domain and transmembrane domain-containing protein 1 [Xyrauchen texanus]|uniref:leucine-rich repeat, immunoglobulin-like domain and transmembrane domain-containing protein 1 n=1 Tax=Xyrauchen texanus TaxID=154827 RepID=UPI00224260B2|nr:leucine-rich repeat, immunoglobulin-like domain and transmembrane domain-containing protein 1 [Xyrauchen texanus]